VLAAGVVVVSLLRNPRAWRAWLILLGWVVVVDLVPVLLGRGTYLPGTLLGLVTRYVWDAVGIAAICVGLAFLPLTGQEAFLGSPRFDRPVRAAMISVVTAFVIGSIWSFYAYPTDPGAAAGRSYVATARIALAEAPAGAVIVDDPVPDDVIGGLFFRSVAASSRLLTPLITGQPGKRPSFVGVPNGTYDHLLEFDGWGRLVPSVVSGAGNLPLATGRSCLPSRDGTAVIRLRSAVTRSSVVRLGYLAGFAGRILVEFGGSADPYTVKRGLHSAYLAVHGHGSIITVVAMRGRLPCIGDAEAGVLLPSGAGPAIPAFAVNG
jgi:hypothetical protein